MGDDLALALRLADDAAAIALPRFRRAALELRRTPDRSRVREVDAAGEAALATAAA